MAVALCYIRKTGWGVTCLTETKWNEVRETVFRNLAKDYWVFCKHREGTKDNDDGSGGVAILVKKDMDPGISIFLAVFGRGTDVFGLRPDLLPHAPHTRMT